MKCYGWRELSLFKLLKSNWSWEISWPCQSRDCLRDSNLQLVQNRDSRPPSPEQGRNIIHVHSSHWFSNWALEIVWTVGHTATGSKQFKGIFGIWVSKFKVDSLILGFWWLCVSIPGIRVVQELGQITTCVTGKPKSSLHHIPVTLLIGQGPNTIYSRTSSPDVLKR